MRIVLFCEQKYAINILTPIQEEALKSGGHDILWYVHSRNIPDFPLKDRVKWTDSIQKIYDYSPEAFRFPATLTLIICRAIKYKSSMVMLPKRKTMDDPKIFRYLLYPRPFFHQRFQRSGKKIQGFRGSRNRLAAPGLDFSESHTFDEEKSRLLQQHQREKLVLYAPTFSPSLTSLPHLKAGLDRLVQEKDILLLLKFHPLTRQEWTDEYREWAASQRHVIWIDDHNITKYQLMADVMISDTSSTVYEFLLLNKPVITFQTVAKDIYWIDIQQTDELPEAYEQALHDESACT